MSRSSLVKCGLLKLNAKNKILWFVNWSRIIYFERILELKSLKSLKRYQVNKITTIREPRFVHLGENLFTTTRFDKWIGVVICYSVHHFGYSSSVLQFPAPFIDSLLLKPLSIRKWQIKKYNGILLLNITGYSYLSRRGKVTHFRG